jgi:hypothetical protein
MQLTCASCRAVLSIDDAFAGGVCRCQHCGAIQTVPSQKGGGGRSPQRAKRLAGTTTMPSATPIDPLQPLAPPQPAAEPNAPPGPAAPRRHSTWASLAWKLLLLAIVAALLYLAWINRGLY